MEIRNLENIDFDTLFAAFEKAFEDYEIHFEKEEVRSMLKRRGYNPKLSFAAFDKDRIVAFTLNGAGSFNGIPTAYDTGTGTIKEYRGLGLAAKIFTHSIPFLKEAGIKQYLLEVLQNNDKAISVYRKMNFKTIRELDCFRQSVSLVLDTPVNAKCDILQVNTDTILRTNDCCDILPSWQNSIESLARAGSDLTCLAAYVDNIMAGHCVIDKQTGDIARIAVSKGHRRNGIASRLLKEAVTLMETDFIKILNIDSNDNTLHLFLESKNIPLASKQFEMLLPLE